MIKSIKAFSFPFYDLQSAGLKIVNSFISPYVLMCLPAYITDYCYIQYKPQLCGVPQGSVLGQPDLPCIPYILRTL